jgi:hypothetical protein
LREGGARKKSSLKHHGILANSATEVLMKGPSGRRRHPMRRTWECPMCHKRLLTSGKAAHMMCTCTLDPDRPIWMQLVQEPRPRPFPRALEPTS